MTKQPFLFIVEHEDGEIVDVNGEGGFTVWFDSSEAKDAAYEESQEGGLPVAVVQYVRIDSASTTIPTADLEALRAKAEVGKRDTARLDFIISESNEGRGWLEDSVWDVASNECEGGVEDTPAGYVRAHIDDQMKKSAMSKPNAE